MWNLLMPFAGSLVSGASSLIGGQMTASSNARAARVNAIAQAQQNEHNEMINQANFNTQMGFAREQFDNSNAQWQMNRMDAMLDRDIQREFAQNGVQWRVNDARAAGIHPLAALGMQGASSSPIQIGTTGSTGIPSANPVTSPAPQPGVGSSAMGNAVASFGQDLSRAITATATEIEREKQVSSASSLLALENQALQNKLLASQIAKTSGAAVGPSFPSSGGKRAIDGQGNTPLIKFEPAEVTRTRSATPHTQEGKNPEVQYFNTPYGQVHAPGKQFKEAIEDDIFNEGAHAIRSRLPSMLGFRDYAPPESPGKNKAWVFNPVLQTWQKKTLLYKDPKGWFNENFSW